MSGRGWTSRDLPVVGDDPKYWTADDAARLLGPPQLTTVQVRQLVRMVSIKPIGKRRTSRHGTSGRYARVYRAVDLIRAFDAVYQVTETTMPER